MQNVQYPPNEQKVKVPHMHQYLTNYTQISKGSFNQIMYVAESREHIVP